MRFQLLLGLSAVTALTACNPEPDTKEPTETGYALQRFNDCDDMRDHIEDAWTKEIVHGYYGYGYYGWGVDESTDDAESGGDSNGGDGGSPSDYSETNNQESGVDEPDMVKTDGNHLYVLHDGELSIIKSWPVEETEELSSLPLEGYASSAFLLGERLIVMGTDYDDDAFIDDDQDWYSYGTRVTVVNVGDPTQPMVERSFLLEGYSAGARMIDGEIYIAMSDYGSTPYRVWDEIYQSGYEWPQFDWWDASELERLAFFDAVMADVRPFVQDALAEVDTEQLLPRVSEDGTTEALLDCREVYHPDTVNSSATLSLVHYDPTAGSLSATGLMSQGWQVYASAENFYISQTSWWWASDDEEVSTRIHRFNLDGADTAYAGSGEVSGWALNQFSFGEHDGHLRVATSDSGWWGDEEPANNVFVLGLREGDMPTVGELTGIAPGERIYSARFSGDKGYLVTFEQIDPLFTLDLSAPTSPAVVGELKVPGYSSYLHPIGDDHILAVGMDGTDDGQITGLAVSLFDISDFANPSLLDKYTLESDDWSWSSALYDHHAFTYHNGTLSIPAYTWTDNEGFSGMLVIDVDLTANTLTELGRVDHTKLVSQSECRYEWEGACEEYYWYAWMQRSVVIEDSLFSISDYGVTASEQRSPETVQATVLFHPSN